MRYSSVIEYQQRVYLETIGTEAGRWFIKELGSRQDWRSAESYEQTVTEAIYSAAIAPPYFVSRDMTALAGESAKSLPTWTVDRDLFPTDRGFVWLDGGLPYPEYPDEIDKYQAFVLAAFSWRPAAVHSDGKRVPGVEVLYWTRAKFGENQEPTHLTTANGLWAFGDDIRAAPLYVNGSEEFSELETQRSLADAQWSASVLGALLLLMKQRITLNRVMVADRGTRRRYAKENKGLAAPEIRVVMYRREDPDHHRSDYQQGSGRKLSVQFAVSGHWREQPYGPQHSLRRPQWIESFWKGPEDAPVKSSTIVRAMVR